MPPEGPGIPEEQHLPAWVRQGYRGRTTQIHEPRQDTELPAPWSNLIGGDRPAEPRQE